MYTPYTVTVYNVDENVDTIMPEYNLTVLDGVFLDISEGSNIMESGLESANAATLFIPFSVTATNAVTGVTQTYLEPKAYEAEADKSKYWTLRKGNEESHLACFFVKGKVDEKSDFSIVKRQHDYVYDVKTIDVRDFGSKEMRHWEVGGA